MFGADLARAKLASLSPVTSETLAELGFRPAAEASRYTIAGLVDAIVDRQQRNRAPAGPLPPCVNERRGSRRFASSMPRHRATVHEKGGQAPAGKVDAK